jgi:hypothetical protein
MDGLSGRLGAPQVHTGRTLAGYLDFQFLLGDEPGGVGDIVFALVERTEKVLGLLDE